MMRKLGAFGLAAVLFAGAARGETMSQTLDYDLAFDEQIFPEFQGFDDQGGTLQLNAITFDWDLNFDVDYRLENTGPTTVNAGDFFMSMEYYTVHQLGIGEGHPAYGPGGMYFNLPEVTLAANDEAPGGDDVAYGTYSESYQRTLSFTAADNPSYIADMIGAGPIATVYGGFAGVAFTWINEPVGWDPPSGMFGEPIYPTDDAIWFFLEETTHAGTVTLTYDYSVVPEPAMAGIAGILGLVVVGRRGRRA